MFLVQVLLSLILKGLPQRRALNHIYDCNIVSEVTSMKSINGCLLPKPNKAKQPVLLSYAVWYSAMPFSCGQFSCRHSQKIPHSSPFRTKYGMYFIGPSVWYSTSVAAFVYAISCNIGPCYKGIRLYMGNSLLDFKRTLRIKRNISVCLCSAKLLCVCISKLRV